MVPTQRQRREAIIEAIGCYIRDRCIRDHLPVDRIAAFNRAFLHYFISDDREFTFLHTLHAMTRGRVFEEAFEAYLEFIALYRDDEE